MTCRARRAGAVLLLAVGCLSACGKKGNPLPPLRPVPARIADVTARRVDDRIELSFVVPPQNADGTTPAAVDRIEVYRFAAAPGAAIPSADAIAGQATNLRGEIRVRSVADAPPSSGAGAVTQPAPGETAVFSDRVDGPATGALASVNYVVVGVTEGRRGRRSVASAVTTVPLAAAPPSPLDVTVTHDETRIRVTWRAGGPGLSFLVYSASRPFEAARAELLTPEALGTLEFTVPVQFGVERCFTLRAVQLTGTTRLEGPFAPLQCVTPVDRYAPPAPANLQAIQEGAAITLNWTAVDATDLAGYIVLRGDASGENMQPLMRVPTVNSTFQDTAVQSGMTYSYSVYALDKAPTANVSQQSNRQIVTVR